MQPDTGRLFLARDLDGLTVFDVDRQKAIATVENSVGANGPLLLPQYNRGYVAMTDGSLLSFDLKTLEPIQRLSLDKEGGLNSGVHDPVTKQVHFIDGTRPAQSHWYTLDAATGKLLKTTTFPFKKMDDPAIDGAGNIYAPARRDNLILKLDSKTLEESARWSVPCNVSKTRWQASTKRILGACVGDKPQFFAFDPATGKVTASVPLSGHLDGIGIDEKRKRIVTSSNDGALTVISQQGADQYELLGTVTTRPEARMSFMDERNGNVYLITADSTTSAPDAAGNAKQVYHPNTFVVLTYKPQ
jgi:DNA-binding beta-propeller fold protein YncE